MMTSRRWYETGRDVVWRKLIAENPIVEEAFEVVLRTVMAVREPAGDAIPQALQNAKRDGIFATLQMLETGLANQPKKKDGTDPLSPVKAWKKKKVDDEPTNDSGAPGSGTV
jgi:hypothetical protein